MGFLKLTRNISYNALARDIHVFSAMLVMLLMLFFAVSGFFLNHPDLSDSDIATTSTTLESPQWLNQYTDWAANYAHNGLKLMLWLDTAHDIRGVDYEFEWDDFDALLIVTLQSPGSNTIIEYFSQEQRIEIEQSPFGLLDTLNNIHRAKHTTTLWRYTSDFSAIVMIIFCLSGLWLALINKNTRRASSQWFVFGSSLFLLVLYLMH
ncbi:MAG: PepSY-associated TM helix domain-containing protein [Psychrobium sp.]|nr:PepSY-associated TM helix domain-containing protein [Psychrobium sp.]